MGLFNMFKKKKNEKNIYKEFECDKAQWQWENAMKEYCSQNDKTPKELTEQDEKIIWEYAGNHIAHFLTWLIKKDFLSEMHEDDFEDIEAVKEENMTGMKFLMKNCDGILTREDIAEEVLDFVDVYYENKYFEDYCACMEDGLNRIVFGISFSWDDYHKIEHLLDEASRDYMCTNMTTK